MLAGCPVAVFKFVNLAAGTASPNWTGCTAARPAGGAGAGACAGVWARLAATAARSAAKRLAAVIDFGRFIESTSTERGIVAQPGPSRRVGAGGAGGGKASGTRGAEFRKLPPSAVREGSRRRWPG